MASINDDTVDVVWASEALMHTTNDSEVIKRMSEVLKHDGQTVIAGIFATERDRSKNEQEMLDTFHQGRNAHLTNINDVTDTLTSNGFRDIERQEITENIVPDLQRGYRFVRWLYLPYVRLCYFLGQKEEHEVKGVSALVVAKRLIERGVLGYFIVSAKLNR